MPTFFVIVPPGLEDVAERELRCWLTALGVPSDIVISREARGGLELELPLEVGFALNRVLKTAARVLVRTSDFGCRDFPKLFRKMKGFDWSDWLFPAAPAPEVHVSTHGSRLRMKNRIAETCADGFRAWRKSHSPSEQNVSPECPGLYVRFDDDICTVSFDTSGEHLHRRGYRTDVPDAPLRESTAAALLLKMFEGVEGTASALVDPMAGSGTFLFEAMTLGSVLDRGYAFQKFACVREGRVVDRKKLTSPSSLPHWTKLVGIDRSGAALSAARSNAERVRGGFESCFFEGDLMERQVPEGLPTGAAVICNPPYGERLKVEGSLTAFYSRMVAAFEETLRPQRVGLLLPAKAHPARIGWPPAWRRVSETSFSNGGIPVVFHVYQRV